MLKILRSVLQEKINDIDAGNSNVDEEGLYTIIKCINEVSNTEQLYNRTEAAKYLQCSVQKFDLYRKAGKIEKGIKKPGGVIQWTKQQLDNLIKKERNGH